MAPVKNLEGYCPPFSVEEMGLSRRGGFEVGGDTDADSVCTTVRSD